MGRERRSVTRNGDDLYLIACSVTRRCKIGRSHRVFSRLDGLQAASPTTLILYCYAPGLGDFEEVLHEVFAAHRLHGEWFDAEVTAAIATVIGFGENAAFAVLVQRLLAKWRVEANKRFGKSRAARAAKTFEWRGKERPL